MVSPEFKAAVSDGNLLRTRIILKDSLILDPTFEQFDEMFYYAKSKLLDLMVNYDGDYLEDDTQKWTIETMNEELVQLVNNFSGMRIEHLKKVVSKVLAKEAESIRKKRFLQAKHENSKLQTNSSVHQNGSSSIGRLEPKAEKRREALRKMGSEARCINKILYEVDGNGNRWKLSNINDLERAAENILKAVSEYKENK